MTLPASWAALIRENNELIIGVLVVVSLLLAFLLLYLLIRMSKLTRLYHRLTRGTSGGNLEEVLTGYVAQVSEQERGLAALAQRVGDIHQVQQRCLQRVGLVRYDAFDDVGGEQSFSVVALDADRNGFAMSSVYSRADVRVYAKAIRAGQPSHPLTDEEMKAMAQAVAQDGTRR